MSSQLISILIIVILTVSLISQTEQSLVNALADSSGGIKASSKFGTLQIDRGEYDVTYVNNTTVQVSGTINNVNQEVSKVTILFILPDGTTKGSQMTVNNDGTFQTTFPLNSDSQKGLYSVSASYDQNIISTLAFTVKLIPVSNNIVHTNPLPAKQILPNSSIGTIPPPLSFDRVQHLPYSNSNNSTEIQASSEASVNNLQHNNTVTSQINQSQDELINKKITELLTSVTIVSHHNENATRLIAKGMEYEHFNKLLEAFLYYDKSIQIDNNNVDAKVHKDSVYNRIKSIIQNLVDINTRLQETPNDPQLLEQRGELFLSLGKYDYSLSDFEKILSTYPTNLLALSGKYVALDKLNRNNESITTLNQLSSTTSLQSYAEFFNLPKSFELYKLGRYSEANNDFDLFLQAMQQNDIMESPGTSNYLIYIPWQDFSYTYKALLAEKTGDSKTANSYYNLLETNYPDQNELTRIKGETLFDIGAYGESVSYLQEYIKNASQQNFDAVAAKDIAYDEIEKEPSLLQNQIKQVTAINSSGQNYSMTGISTNIGVKTGEWVKYKITGLSFTSNNPYLNQLLQNSFSSILGQEYTSTGSSLDWFKWNVEQVTGTKIVIGTSVGLSDGTIKNTGNTVFDISNYQNFPLVIPIDLKVGDQIPSSYSNPLKVVKIKSIDINNKHLDVFELIATDDKFTDMGSFHKNSDFYYDKNTGMLIAIKFDESVVSQGVSAQFNIVGNAVDFSDDLLKSDNNNPINSFMSFLKNLFGSFK